MLRFRPLLLLCSMLAMAVLQSGCASTGGGEPKETLDLWKTWENMDVLLQPDYPDAPPIILMHGWNGSEFTWPPPDELRRLEGKLHRDIYFFTYRTGYFANRYPPLEIMEEALDRFLSEYKTVDVVAHSMGGLLLRQYLSHHPDNPVRRIVFLSTPHFGTNAAKVLTRIASVSADGNIQAQEIQPGSDFLWDLNEQEGSELQGIEALNVYVGESGWLDGDLVVEPASAYLPWAHNVKVQGDHHTLARRLASFQFIIDFLKDGTLPSIQAEMPARRDVWLQFVSRPGGEPMRIPASSIRHLSPKGIPTKDGFNICCDARAGLYPNGGNTVVAEDVQPGEVYEYIPHNGHGKVNIPMDALRDGMHPVLLKTIVVPPPPGVALPEPAVPSPASTTPASVQPAPKPEVKPTPRPATAP